MFKLMTFIGTRPEIIRMSRIMSRIDEYYHQVIVHTGQNYDYELNEIFFTDMDIRMPDYELDIDTSTLESSVGTIIQRSGELLRHEKPDAVMVLGDTNSCMSAYMAKRLHIPIYHLEAGNRCFDERTPEEVNRKIIDHISDYNLVYSEHARRNLIREGLPENRIFLIGSPMREVLNYYAEKIDKSEIMEKLKLEPFKYFLVSMHREETVDHRIDEVEGFLYELASRDFPVIFPVHPRTRKRIHVESLHPMVRLYNPFSFTDYVKLEQNALCTISDSGTIAEESAVLNFPAVTLRESMERPEARDRGSIILTGFRDVMKKIDVEINSPSKKSGYEIDDTSWRVLKLLR